MGGRETETDSTSAAGDERAGAGPAGKADTTAVRFRHHIIDLLHKNVAQVTACLFGYA